MYIKIFGENEGHIARKIKEGASHAGWSEMSKSQAQAANTYLEDESHRRLVWWWLGASCVWENDFEGFVPISFGEKGFFKNCSREPEASIMFARTVSKYDGYAVFSFPSQLTDNSSLIGKNFNIPVLPEEKLIKIPWGSLLSFSDALDKAKNGEGDTNESWAWMPTTFGHMAFISKDNGQYFALSPAQQILLRALMYAESEKLTIDEVCRLRSVHSIDIENAIRKGELFAYHPGRINVSTANEVLIPKNALVTWLGK